ncbi:MAG: GIY-YIG nuclease family protein [bacterium]
MSKKITLFLIDDLPKGLRSVRIDQWIGKAICSPRSNIKKINYEEIATSSCLYFLIGYSDIDNSLNVYVGETDTFNNRVNNHNYNKEWWSEIVVFYSLDSSLTKTSARYLEKLCIEKLKKAGKCTLMNGNERLADAIIAQEDKSGMELFLENVTTILPLLGYDIFEQSEIRAKGNKGIKMTCSGKGAQAQGLFLDDGKMLVLKGSLATKKNAPNFENHNYRRLKDKLLEIGKLKDDGKYLVFNEDHEFSSPSAAAAIILARSASGPNEWKDSKGAKLKDLLQEQ